MKDLFYTILITWIIWRILNSVNTYRYNQSQNAQRKKRETTVDYTPPAKKKISDNEGEYVDYEEIK